MGPQFTLRGRNLQVALVGGTYESSTGPLARGLQPRIWAVRPRSGRESVGSGAGLLATLELPAGRFWAELGSGRVAEVVDLNVNGIRVTLLPTASSRAERSPDRRAASDLPGTLRTGLRLPRSDGASRAEIEPDRAKCAPLPVAWVYEISADEPQNV